MHPSFGRPWPTCDAGKNLVTVRGPEGLAIPVHKELAPLVLFLVEETERRGYDLVTGWCWGYACREIRGSNPKKPSNHSDGTAVDINAPKNPMGSRLITDMPPWMVALWEAYGFRWGGNYRSRPDAMHYEFMLSVADARRLIAEIRAGNSAAQVGLPLKAVKNPTYNETAKQYQKNINKWIAGHDIKDSEGRPLKPLVEDGKFGNVSAVYTVHFKRWVISIQKAFHQTQWPNSDAVVGPITYSGAQHWANN